MSEKSFVYYGVQFLLLKLDSGAKVLVRHLESEKRIREGYELASSFSNNEIFINLPQENCT